MNKIIYSLFLLLLSFTCIAQTEFTGILTAKCNIQQTGSGSGYWTVGISNFNDPRGNDATAIQVGDKVYFNDGGVSFALPITLISSAVGNSATVRVSNSGITYIGSVPTTTAVVSRATSIFQLPPWAANVSGNDNQMLGEYRAYLIDSLAAPQTIDTFSLSGTTLQLSLSGDGEAKKTVDLSGLGGGTYTGSNGVGVVSSDLSLGNSYMTSAPSIFTGYRNLNLGSYGLRLGSNTDSIKFALFDAGIDVLISGIF